MKIIKWIEYNQEIEIEIGTDDVIVALLEGSEDCPPKQAVTRAVNNLANVFRKMPDSAIAELSGPARHTIAEFLAEQEKRFRQ